MKYHLLKSKSESELTKMVNAFLELGWEPHSEPQVSTSSCAGKDGRNYPFVSRDTIYAQSVVIDEDKPWYPMEYVDPERYTPCTCKRKYDDIVVENCTFTNGSFIALQWDYNDLNRHKIKAWKLY